MLDSAHGDVRVFCVCCEFGDDGSLFGGFGVGEFFGVVYPLSDGFGFFYDAETVADGEVLFHEAGEVFGDGFEFAVAVRFAFGEGFEFGGEGFDGGFVHVFDFGRYFPEDFTTGVHGCAFVIEAAGHFGIDVFFECAVQDVGVGFGSGRIAAVACGRIAAVFGFGGRGQSSVSCSRLLRAARRTSRSLRRLAASSGFSAGAAWGWRVVVGSVGFIWFSVVS